jgi:Na+-transporting methylmalonyl-CoA/oxaloacetate decarboxylase beta subunit
MCYPETQDVFHSPQRILLWTKRVIGFVIVVSGGVLLTTDLVSAISRNDAPMHVSAAVFSVPGAAP